MSKSSSVISWRGKFLNIDYKKIKSIIRETSNIKTLHDLNLKKEQIIQLPMIDQHKYLKLVKQPFSEKEGELMLFEKDKRLHKIKVTNYMQAIAMFKMMGFTLSQYIEYKIETWAYGDNVVITYVSYPLLEPYLDIFGSNSKDVNDILKIFKLDKKSKSERDVEELYSDLLGIPIQVVREIPYLSFNNSDEVFIKYSKTKIRKEKKRNVRRRRKQTGELVIGNES